MKIKITSLLLIIALLTSLFTVYSFASELVETVSNGDGYAISYVHYKNSFGDEIDDVGKTLVLENSVDSTYEVRSETNGNKYYRVRRVIGHKQIASAGTANFRQQFDGKRIQPVSKIKRSIHIKQI